MLSFKQYAFDYTEENLEEDVQKLREMFENKFQPNQKVINTILDKIYESNEESVELDIALRMEIDRFELVVETAMMAVKTAEDVAEHKAKPIAFLEHIVCWLANNGTAPDVGWNDNAQRRYHEIMKKLGHE